MVETFYTSFYGLRAPPFHVTPDASLFFATDTHQQAMGAIEYGVAAGKGFIVVTGEVGVGKTTVLRAVLDRFDATKARVIYLFDPDLSVAELYLAILEGLDSGTVPSTEPGEALRQVQETLLKVNKRGVAVVLAVDEAQNMSESTLEHLRVLSNLETAKSKLLQIVLVGQPELDAMLRRPSLRQLAQRVAVRARIAPLGFAQSCRYILHRLACCGRPLEPPLFTTPALWYIAWRARGIPRSLNILCDNALINGYGHRATRLTLPIVREAVKPLLPRWRVRPAVVWAGAMVLVGLGGLYLHGMRMERSPPRVGTEARAGTEVSIPAAPDQPPVSPVTNVPAGAAPAGKATSPTTDSPDTEAQSPPVAAAAVEARPDAPPIARNADQEPAGGSSAAETGAAASAADEAVTSNVSDEQAGSSDVAVSTRGEAHRAPKTAGDGRRGVRTWHVKRGDSLYKACRTIYGRCDRTVIRAILALNPKLARRNLWPGDVILLPDMAAGERAAN